VRVLSRTQHCRVAVSKIRSSLNKIPTQKQEKESNQRPKNQQALLAAREGIGAKPISLVLGKASNFLCLGLETGLLSATDGAIPVVWQLLRHQSTAGVTSLSSREPACDKAKLHSHNKLQVKGSRDSF
jgi:hypothetical protein